jgi:eukaryotic-like serine/threonine-protein kinase
MSVDPREPSTVEKTASDSVNAGQVPPPPRPFDMPAPSGGPRYVLGDEIARGGMGAVLHAHDERLNRDLAVKVLHAELRDSPGLRQRFAEEAQIAGQLQHPGVVPVYDLGVLADGLPFFAMKLVKGRTLADRLHERPDAAHDLPHFLKIFEQVCQTMAYAHSRRVIHRDLKPSNVMVGAFGEVQVMDWGIAKVLDRAAPVPPPAQSGRTDPPTEIRTERLADPGQATRAGSVMGTYPYMAPEQARGQADCLDERADVFGLGAILCEVLTGNPPYVAPTPDEVRVLALVGDQAAARARLDRCGADIELLDLVRTCLAADRNQRPRDAGAVAAAMTAYLDGVQRRLRQAEAERASAQVKAGEERKRRRLTVAVAAALLLAVLSGAAAWLLTQQQRQQQRRQTTRVVEQAVGQAIALREQAREAPVDTPAQRERAAQLWRDALAAADRADQALAGGPADDDVRRRVADLLAETRAEAADADKDRLMLGWLERARDLALELQESDYIRPHHGGEIVYGGAAAPAYAAAFRDYGIDVEALPPAAAAERIRRRPIRLRLALALDDWYFIDPAGAGGRLPEVSRAADPDPLRDRLRRAVAARDREALKGLAGDAGLGDLPASSLVLLADVLRQQELRSEAVGVLRLARRRYPQDFWAHDILGLHLLFGEPPDPREAGRCFAAAAALRPDSPLGWSNLGAALAYEGRVEEAVAALREARRVRPDFTAGARELVQYLVWVGKLEEARAELEAALRLRPDSPMLATERAGLLVAEGKADEAEAAYRDVLDRHPEWVLARLGLAQLLTRAGRTDEALRLLADAERTHPDLPELHRTRGEALARRDDAAGALAAYRKEVDLNPRRAAGRAYLGIFLLAQGQKEEAVKALRQAVELAPGNVSYRLSLAEALSKAGRPAESVVEASLALRRAEQWPATEARAELLAWAHHRLGVALSAVGELEQAEDHLRQAIRLRDGHPAYHEDLGIVLWKRGKTEEAIGAYAEAARLGPDWARVRNRLGNAYYNLGRYDEAADAYREALDRRGDSAVFAFNLAGAEMGRGRFGPAEEAARQAVALKGDYAGARLRLGVLLLRRGQAAEAETHLRRAVALAPKDAEVHSWLGEALRRQGKKADALEEARQAASLPPGSAGVQYRLGEALAATGRYDEALAAFLQARQLRPPSPDPDEPEPLPWDERVAAARRDLELDRALAAVRDGKVRAVDPVLLADLGRFCAESGDEPLRAVRFYADAFAAAPALADDRAARRRFGAACAAARAAAVPEESLGAEERRRWRRQALDWLRADLDAWEKDIDGGSPLTRLRAWAALASWRREPALASVRDPEALGRLPQEERDAWRKLWADVDAALRRVE